MEPQPGDLPQGLEIFMNILPFSIPFLVLLLAYITGKVTEKRHYASIHEREGALGSTSRPSPAKHLPDHAGRRLRGSGRRQRGGLC